MNRNVALLMFGTVTLFAAADAPNVNDGLAHGDPPFLVEEGWRPLLNGKNLEGWKYRTPDRGGWVTTKGVIWGATQAPKALAAVNAPGDRIVNSNHAPGAPASDLISEEKFGDMELYVEFMIPANSNAGVFLFGQYEIQIWDSYGKDLGEHITDICGAIYNYEPPPRPERTPGAQPPAPGQRPRYILRGGVAPAVRAERAPGQWQSYHVWFQGPKFDESGNKIANAKFLRVLHNGILIHENVERTARTQASLDAPEASTGPIMLQGDHGAVAFRNIYVRPLRSFTAAASQAGGPASF